MINDPSAPSSAPLSRGAQILSLKKLKEFLQDSFWICEQNGSLGALLLVRLDKAESNLDAAESQRAQHLLGQLAKQVDAIAQVDDQQFAIVCSALGRRGDAHLMMDRIEDFVNSSDLGWEISTGVAVFPLSGDTPKETWRSAQRDLEGALSHESWEHDLPRDTLPARIAG